MLAAENRRELWRTIGAGRSGGQGSLVPVLWLFSTKYLGSRWDETMRRGGRGSARARTERGITEAAF
jgi:hypothetical protein